MRTTTRNAVLSVGCLLGAASALALDPERPINAYMVDFWQESSGLPQSFVKAIRQTSDGYLWVATKGGLGRFDGVRFKTYDDLQPSQLLEAEVWDAVEDADGSVWAATQGGGLSHLKEGRITTYTVDQGLPSNNLTALARASDNTLWIGTIHGLARMQAGRITSLTTADGLPSHAIFALHADRDGTVWIGTDRGLVSYEGGRLVNYAAAHPGVLDAPVGSISGNRSEGVWLGSSVGGNRGRGLRRLKGGAVTTWTTKDGLPSDTVIVVKVDERGVVWIGTQDGLCRFRNGKIEVFQTEVTSLSARRTIETVSLRNIQALQVDREGSLWVGTSTEGLCRLRDVPFTSVMGGEGVGLDVYTVVYETRDGAAWVGSMSGIARLAHGTTNGYKLPGGAQAIVEDRDGTVWLGTPAGMYRWRAGVLSRVALGGLDTIAVTALASDSNGDLWIGTREDGLYRRSSGATMRFGDQQGLVGSQVRALTIDGRGRLLVGTRDGGLNILEGSRFRYFGPKEGLASATAQALSVLGDGTIWVATKRGLSRVRDGAIATVTAQQGLPANYFYQLVADNDHSLWLTYGRGVARVSLGELGDVADGKACMVTAALFGSESGLRSTFMPARVQPAAFRGQDGRLWFATGRGAAVIDPRALGLNPVPPPVHVEEILVDGRAQPLRPAELPPGNIEIHYTALSFVAPQRVRFKFMLEGFDEAWRDAGARRVAYYTNIPPGHYTFRVVACNNDGVWNNEGASLSFRLLPRWYQTRVFLLLTGLTGVGIVVGLFRLRVRRHVRMERELRERVTAALADVKTLHGLLPICAWCKKVRDDSGYWNQLEEYVSEHTQAEFSHGICPDCRETMYASTSRSSGSSTTP